MRAVSVALTLLLASPALAQNVTTIGGKQYAESQFVLTGPEGGCDHNHYHAANGTFVTATDGTTLTDPNLSGCGFDLLTFSPIPTSTGP